MTQTQQLNQNLTGTKIDNGALELVSVIGIGAYGVVYKALARDGKYYAVKCLNKTGLDSRQKGFQRREIALHTLASSHPNIVSLHNVIETSTCIYVVLSYCSDGDLFSQITEKSRYLGNDALIKDVFLQIVDAVDYCHKLGIYHRDLKPENILCDALGARVVLADFGLATAEKTSGDFGCGSTFYMSPECQGGLFQRLGSYSTLQNDVWSLGVILVNLTCGRNPWKQACPSDETFRAYLSNPDFLQSILPVSKQCNELLKRIFALNPASRISIKELKYEVSRISRWTMTLDELRYATRATKEAARAWAPAYILDDPCDAPPAKPLQPAAAPHHHQQHPVPHQVAQPRVAPQAQQYQHQQAHYAASSRHQAASAQAQPKPRQARETVFDITDSSTVSSVDSLAEWKAHQAHLQQQQARRQQHAGARLQSPYIPSPAPSPSVSSAACPEFPAPVVPALAKARLQQQQQLPQQQAHIRSPAQNNLRSDFSLSDSDESSMDEDDMEYAGGRSPLYHSSNTRAQHYPQQQYQTRHSPNPNSVSHGSRPTHFDYATRSKNSPPPPLVSTQAPRTPRQAFTTAAAAANRQRKQSIESNSSSSSISSDASWTGLPPTPDTPVFAKRHAAAIASAKGNGSPTSMQHIQPQEKQSLLSSLTSPIAIAGAKLKMAF